MLKAGKLSEVLTSVSNSIGKSRVVPSAESLLIMLVTGDGQLLSCSVANDTPNYSPTERIAAVVASIATEYRAIDKIMKDEFKCFSWSSGNRLIRCSHFCDLKDKGSVLLILSIEQSASPKLHSFLRALATRLEDDLLPSLSPIMENMISAPPADS